jgi:lupus La protein
MEIAEEDKKRPREEDEAAASASAAVAVAASDADPAEPSAKRAKAEVDADAVAKLMAFYFSDSNLRRDKFLIAEQAKDSEGYVGLRVLLTFNKLKALVTDPEQLVEVVASHKATKDLLVVAPGRDAVKRAQPVPDHDDSNERTVFVDGFPTGGDRGGGPEPEIDAIVSLFETYGEVVLVRKRRGGGGGGGGGYNRRDAPKRFLGSVFVEFKEKTSVQACCAMAAAVGITLDAAGGASSSSSSSSSSPSSSSSSSSSSEAAAEEASTGEGETAAKSKKLRVCPIDDWLEENRKAREQYQSSRGGGDGGGGGGGEGGGRDKEQVQFDAGKILKLSNVREAARSYAAKREAAAAAALAAGEEPSSAHAAVNRFLLKEIFGSFGIVRFVDFSEGEDNGFVRFDTAEGAKAALDAYAASGGVCFAAASKAASWKAPAAAAAEDGGEAKEGATKEDEPAAPAAAVAAGNDEVDDDDGPKAVVTLLEGEEEKQMWQEIASQGKNKSNKPGGHKHGGKHGGGKRGGGKGGGGGRK